MSIRVLSCSCQSLCRTTCQIVRRALLPGHTQPFSLTGPGTLAVKLLQASRHLDAVHFFQKVTRLRLPVGRENDLHPGRGDLRF